MPDGFKKVGRKTRNGRKRRPQGHGSHRTIGTIKDPIARQKKIDFQRKRFQEEDYEWE